MNEHGVPYHGYSLTLADGSEVIMDVGNREDYARVVRATTCKDDTKVLWYSGKNTATEIRDVFDCETEEHLVPAGWFDDDIRPLFRNYYPEDSK